MGFRQKNPEPPTTVMRDLTQYPSTSALLHHGDTRWMLASRLQSCDVLRAICQNTLRLESLKALKSLLSISKSN